MTTINFADMERTRQHIREALEFPYHIYLCARRIDNVQVTEFLIGRAKDSDEANDAMYKHFDDLRSYVVAVRVGPNEREHVTKLERLARFAEEVFGECVFSIVVKNSLEGEDE